MAVLIVTVWHTVYSRQWSYPFNKLSKNQHETNKFDVSCNIFTFHVCKQNGILSSWIFFPTPFPSTYCLVQFCDKKYCSVIVLPTKAEVGSTSRNEKSFYAVLSSKWNCFLDVDCLGSRLRDQTPQLDIADGT